MVKFNMQNLKSKFLCLTFLIACLLLSCLSYAEHRIISLAPHVTENLYAIGAGDMIVGASSYTDYPIEAKHIPVVASSSKIDIEAVMLLNPSLVISWCDSNLKQIKQLEELGYKIYQSCPKKLMDIPKELEELGQLLDRKEKSLEIANKFRNGILTLTRHNKEKVLVFYYINLKPLLAVANDTMQNDIINVCSGQNIMNEYRGYPKVSIEYIVKSSPDLIISNNSDYYYWKELDLKNSKVVYVNPDHLLRPTTRILTGIEVLCKAIDKIRT